MVTRMVCRRRGGLYNPGERGDSEEKYEHVTRNRRGNKNLFKGGLMN